MAFICHINEVIIIKFNSKWITIILILCFITLLIPACSQNSNNSINYDGPDLSNIQGNLINYGFLAEGINCIYYTKFDDPKLSLYKYDQISPNKIKLHDVGCSYINVAGGWIYYSNQDDNNKIYRIDINGQNNQKLIDVQTAYLLAGKALYFVSAGEDKNYLYSSENNGNDIIKLSNDDVDQIYLYEDALYYLSHGQKEEKGYNYVYRINNDKSIELVYKSSDYIDWFWIYNDNIYYKNHILKIVKYDPINGVKEEIVKDPYIYDINIYNNYVFYVSTKGGLHRLDVNSGQDLLISGSFLDNIYIANGRIFHYKNDVLYSMNLDGNDNKKI
ncbi:MAG: DUF5050 domain-containing protein [Syntrophomonadaceae bacterium]|jgi:hypothetical protein|nr:DUF5050 domain-containing protein [Syntrophomonadaceae bacterium]